MKKKYIYKYLFVVLFVAGLVGIDILTKVLLEGKTINIIGDFFVFQSVHNFGAGLGILSGQRILLIVLTSVLIVSFVMFDVFYKNQSKLYFVAFNFILAGAIGNLIDRIFLGYVRDFIYINIKIMPYYFNIADVLLTFGVVLLIIEILFKRERKKNDSEVESK